MQGPLMFQRPEQIQVDSVPIDVHNRIVAELDDTKNELTRARQKIAHLLKEIEELKTK